MTFGLQIYEAISHAFLHCTFRNTSFFIFLFLHDSLKDKNYDFFVLKQQHLRQYLVYAIIV
ncbi:hypothetical protein OUZ56_029640 [Daphnia magna]|uniref:Uncharacterized protein n=1 Tax=Daphnia magna TaxID=35525 RepID=A0ABR0B7F7_9CRUS|nr:hypothetical protein OUZ56_029640 [Daphnia magna]